MPAGSANPTPLGLQSLYSPLLDAASSDLAAARAALIRACRALGDDTAELLLQSLPPAPALPGLAFTAGGRVGDVLTIPVSSGTEVCDLLNEGSTAPPSAHPSAPPTPEAPEEQGSRPMLTPPELPKVALASRSPERGSPRGRDSGEVRRSPPRWRGGTSPPPAPPASSPRRTTTGKSRSAQAPFVLNALVRGVPTQGPSEYHRGFRGGHTGLPTSPAPVTTSVAVLEALDRAIARSSASRRPSGEVEGIFSSSADSPPVTSMGGATRFSTLAALRRG